jgi:hypothetical protein
MAVERMRGESCHRNWTVQVLFIFSVLVALAVIESCSESTTPVIRETPLPQAQPSPIPDAVKVIPSPEHARYVPCHSLLRNPYAGKGEVETLDLRSISTGDWVSAQGQVAAWSEV